MINSNFGFTPLKEVWLGDCYPESFYDHLPNEIADPFRLITQWTKEDTGKLQKFLESRGIVVRRPTFTFIDNYLNSEGRLVKPPVTPRDNYMVLGKTLYSLHNKLKTDPWQQVLDDYKSQQYDVQSPTHLPVNCLCPPSIVRVGKDLYLDHDSHPHVWGFICQWMVESSQNYRINICSTSGHSDGVFCPVAPGVIVSSHYKNDYHQCFPGWEVFKIPEKLNNFGHDRVSPAWYTNDKTINDNQHFSQHIQTHAKSWVGNFEETVFEVNMLVLDEKNVVAMKNYPPLTAWLAERGITVHFFDLRTRSFWDGGWHCFTLDINRDDDKTDLFPDRGGNGVYWRLD
jgi:hypothetical protein